MAESYARDIAASHPVISENVLDWMLSMANHRRYAYDALTLGADKNSQSRKSASEKITRFRYRCSYKTAYAAWYERPQG